MNTYKVYTYGIKRPRLVKGDNIIYHDDNAVTIVKNPSNSDREVVFVGNTNKIMIIKQ